MDSSSAQQTKVIVVHIGLLYLHSAPATAAAFLICIMDQFIEESKNKLTDLISIKGGSALAFLDPDVHFQKVDPPKRLLRWSPMTFLLKYTRKGLQNESLVNIPSLSSFRRTRSLNAPSPVQQFGPCGRIMKNSAMVM